MTTIKKVAVAGATGTLGTPVTKALLEAGFEVTALTRNASAQCPHGVQIAVVDYSSKESLQKALYGQDALISTINTSTPGAQDLLFDTAISQKVQRLIPSEFGSDTISPEPRALPVYASKVALQDHIKSKIVDTETTYTFVLNNAFLDYGLQHDLLINRKTRTAQLFDGGDIPFTMTPLSMVGDAVVGVLRKPQETANQIVKVHGVTVTQKQLIQLYEKFSPGEWTTTPYDTKEGVKHAYETLRTNPGDIGAWVVPMMSRVAYGRGSDNNWEHNNDDKLLGITPLTEAQLESYVKAAVL